MTKGEALGRAPLLIRTNHALQRPAMNTDITEHLLGKPLHQLSDDDVATYFKSEQEESDMLEFKSGDVDLGTIYKEVAAFANTRGGVLILGAPLEKEIQREKETYRVCKGSLTTCTKLRGKDWLLQKICSNVAPMPIGMRAQEFTTGEGKRFVVEIPQSLSPPHQVSNSGVYFIRLDRTARPADHAFVQSMFNQRRRPLLEARFKAMDWDEDHDKVFLQLTNLSDVPADRVGLIAHISNINGVEGYYRFKKEEPGIDPTWSLNLPVEQLLVRPLTVPITIDVQHNQQPYFISIGFWSSEASFRGRFWVYDPLKKMVIQEGEDDEGDALESFRKGSLLLEPEAGEEEQ